jgi:hypothetical protein
LIVALNGTKEAAEKNGGLVADKELDLLYSDKDVPVSMSCREPFDSCSSCGNRARSRAEYCKATTEGGSCKHGGLSSNMGRVCEDGHQLRAMNPPSLRFFDISHVPYQADRIAYVLGTFRKEGSTTPIRGGAWLAEEAGVLPPAEVPPLLDAGAATLVKLCHAAAALERDLTDNGWGDSGLCLHLPLAVVATVDSPRAKRAALEDAHRGGRMFDLPGFVRLLAGGRADILSGVVKEAAGRLPGVYGRVVASDDVCAWAVSAD